MSVNPALVRAVRGPIVLMAIGALFALDHQGVLRFQQTWPILIIVVGVMKLLERMADRTPPAPTYPGGEVR